MRTTKRLVSFLLVVVMLCGVIPFVETEAATISLNRPLDKAYTITAREYYSSGSYHGAVDYGCPKGTPVYAAESGIITVHDGGFGDGYYGCQDGNSWGNYADISHGNGYYTRYAHMSAGRFVVASGTSVQRGRLIGYSGNSGSSTGPHLHFGLYLNGLTSAYKVYPEPYIKTATGYHEGATVQDNHLPVGFLDGIATDARKVTVSGWAYDQDDFNRAVEIHVYIGTTCIGTGVANQYRPDVNTDWIHHGAGEYHGYEIICNVPSNLTGSQIIDVYAIDAESTHHPKLENGIGAVDVPDYVDIGTNFTALIIHAESSKMIESDINNSEIPHVRINEETGLANQLWYFERQDDGSYKISSCYDGTFLDVRNALYASGTPIQTCHDTGTDAQKWYIAEYNGGYGFISKLSNMAMDLPYNNMESSTALQMHERNQSSAQTWSIVRNENTELKGPKLTVHAGDDKTKTTFSWTAVYGAKEYALYIHKNQIGSGELIAHKAGSATGVELDLPVGTYHAYVDSEHAYDYQMGNVVTFTISEHICAYTSVETKPTCTIDGKAVYTCETCSDTYTEIIPATGHNYENNVCTICGDELIVDFGVELSVSDVQAVAGETVTVEIVVNKNVGFTYLNLLLDYDATAMELVSVSNGTIVNSLTQGRRYIWAQADNAVATGVLATLTFAAKEDAPAGEYTVAAEVIECCNEQELDVTVGTADGKITVIDFVYGDCNGDNAIDGKDVTRLLRYLANYDPVSGTSGIEISRGADATGDGAVNGKDATRLLRYLANYDPVTGESSAELG